MIIRWVFFVLLITGWMSDTVGGESVMELQLTTRCLGNAFFAGDSVQVNVTVIGGGEKAGDIEIAWRCTDFWGTLVTSGTKRLRELRSDVALNLGLLPPGWYLVHADVLMEKHALAGGTTTVSVLHYELPPPPPDDPFGLNGGALFHIGLDKIVSIGQDRLALSALLGARWGRNDMWWGTIEPKRGTFDWSLADLTVKTYFHDSIRLMPILCYDAAWSQGKSPDSDKARADFANYVKLMVERYRPSVKYWEVWNEPNIDQFWHPIPHPRDYAKLLKVAYAAAKKADPDCRIVGLATAGPDTAFIRAVYREIGKGDKETRGQGDKGTRGQGDKGTRGQGDRREEEKRGRGEDDFDILSVHNYFWGVDDIRRDLAGVRQVMREFGDGEKPIWITEIGWPTRLGPGETLKNQACKLLKVFTVILHNRLAERIFYFNLDDWMTPESGDWSGNLGLTYPDRTLKPSFIAYRELIRHLRGRTPGGKQEEGTKRVFVFKGKEDETAVVWSERKSGEEIMLKVDGDNVTICDLMGREQEMKVNKGTVKISVTGEPIFLTGRRVR